MKKTISLRSRTAWALVLVLTLGLTTEIAKADFTFGTPTNLGHPISTPYGDVAPCITADGLEMYINYYDRPGGYGGYDIWISTRETVNDDWGAPVNLGSPVDTGLDNARMHHSPKCALLADSLTLSSSILRFSTCSIRVIPVAGPRKLPESIKGRMRPVAAARTICAVIDRIHPRSDIPPGAP